MKRLVMMLAMLAGMTSAHAPFVHAQPMLDITRTDITRFPVVELRIEVTSNGALLRNFTRTDFTVFENGAPMTVDDLTCPEDSFTRFSIGILIDRSRSMTLTGTSPGELDHDSLEIKAAKQAVSTFLGFLTDRDEAMVASFSSDLDQDTLQSVFYEVNQSFTYDTAALRRSLVPIRAFGGTWLWHAIINTLDSLAPRHGKRILIVLTDGQNQDGSSDAWLYTSSSVITHARLLKIPIYTIGLGDGVDDIELSAVASGTGGLYMESPDKSTLEDVFRALANRIITDGCILRYTSRNACLDGGTRAVNVEVRTASLTADDTTSYTLRNGLLPATLAIAPGPEIPARTHVRVPVMMAETVSLAHPLAYTVTVHYDPSVLQFTGVGTDGTISQGLIVQSDASVPGAVRITMAAQTPRTAGGALFVLDFDALGRSDTGRSTITLSDAWMHQTCPLLVTVTGAPFTVVPCTMAFALTVDAPGPIPNGAATTVPVTISPAMQAGVAFDLSCDVQYDPDHLTFLGIQKESTLAAQCQPVVSTASGRVTLRMTGVSTDSAAVLAGLRFQAVPSVNAEVSSVTVANAALRTECVTTFTVRDGRVMMSGACERILERVVSSQYVANHPNPFNPSTAVEFGLPLTGRTLLRILDAAGREVACLIDGDITHGVWRTVFDAHALPSGVYYAVLDSPAGRTVHPLLLAK